MGVNSCHWSVDVRNICLFVCLFVPNPTLTQTLPVTEDGNDEISKARKALVLGTLGEKFGQCCWKNGTSGWE